MAVDNEIYESAVKGRQDFRTAYRRERERAKAAEALNAELLEALKAMIAKAEGRTVLGGSVSPPPVNAEGP